jgi:hypothetical protein
MSGFLTFAVTLYIKLMSRLLEFVRNNPGEWDWYELSKNPQVNWDDMMNHETMLWKPRGVSENPNVTWIDVLHNEEYPWDYSHMSRNTNISMEIISRHNKPWSISHFMLNPVITWRDIEVARDHFGVMIGEACSCCITWVDVLCNPDHPWDWGYLSANPMDRPYYSSSVHKRKLPDTCGEELARVCRS